VFVYCYAGTIAKECVQNGVVTFLISLMFQMLLGKEVIVEPILVFFKSE